MTVTSLWTVLDESNCGTPVGINDFKLRTSDTSKPTVLAIDLSIWICEALSSTALCSFHKDPELHLVYQRTIKLLRLGFGLIFVMDGKRRVRRSLESHELKQRRSGSQFRSASERCGSLLRLLGVPVVQAEAEGEALCALLNSRGICDGVVSNDGDCFLFGAKTLYTKFTIENMENHQVIRYNAAYLSARCESIDSMKDSDATPLSESMVLSRDDLVAFALLTGSDLLGSGVPNVGYKKAINLMHAFKKLKYQPNNRTCLNELLSWGDDVAKQASIMNKELCTECDDDGPITINERCCSNCLHPGDKISHEKHGCLKCHTNPGEKCRFVTKEEKFVRSVKAKVMKLSSFANRNIVDEYFSPNSNTIPNELTNLTENFSIFPKNSDLFNTSLIVKGHTALSSKECIRETLPPLLARLELWRDHRNKYIAKPLKYKPALEKIEKQLVKEFTKCYEVKWSIDIGDESKLEFYTTEPQALLQNSKFSIICKSFHQQERRKVQELDRQKHFIGQKPNVHKRRSLNSKQREKNFRRSMKPSYGRRRERKFPGLGVSTTMRYAQMISVNSCDVEMLIGSIPTNARKTKDKYLDDELDPIRVHEDASSTGEKTYPCKYNDDFDGLEASTGVCQSENKELGYSEETYGCYWDQVKGSSTFRDSACSIECNSTWNEHLFRNVFQGDDVSGWSLSKTLEHDPNYSSFDGKLNDYMEGVHYSSVHDNMPILSPSNHERLFVDLGIQVAVTPIVSRR